MSARRQAARSRDGLNSSSSVHFTEASMSAFDIPQIAQSPPPRPIKRRLSSSNLSSAGTASPQFTSSNEAPSPPAPTNALKRSLAAGAKIGGAASATKSLGPPKPPTCWQLMTSPSEKTSGDHLSGASSAPVEAYRQRDGELDAALPGLGGWGSQMSGAASALPAAASTQQQVLLRVRFMCATSINGVPMYFYVIGVSKAATATGGRDLRFLAPMVIADPEGTLGFSQSDVVAQCHSRVALFSSINSCFLSAEDIHGTAFPQAASDAAISLSDPAAAPSFGAFFNKLSLARGEAWLEGMKNDTSSSSTTSDEATLSLRVPVFIITEGEPLARATKGGRTLEERPGPVRIERLRRNLPPQAGGRLNGAEDEPLALCDKRLELSAEIRALTKEVEALRIQLRQRQRQAAELKASSRLSCRLLEEEVGKMDERARRVHHPSSTGAGGGHGPTGSASPSAAVTSNTLGPSSPGSSMLSPRKETTDQAMHQKHVSIAPPPSSAGPSPVTSTPAQAALAAMRAVIEDGESLVNAMKSNRLR